MHLTNYCKKYLQNFKYSVKRVCSFHLILVGIPSILILSVKNRGGGRGQNLIIVTKVTWRQSLLYDILGEPVDDDTMVTKQS